MKHALLAGALSRQPCHIGEAARLSLSGSRARDGLLYRRPQSKRDRDGLISARSP